MTRTRRLRFARRGFTLVELMVVLFIMGLLATAVVLTAPRLHPGVSEEGERLAARLKRAREEAVLTNRTVDVAMEPGGYRFRTQRRGVWQALDEAPFEPHLLEGGVSLALSAADGAAGVRFDSTGGAGPAKIALTDGTRRLSLQVDEAGNVSVNAPGA